MDWKNYYKLPLKSDDYGCYAWDNEGGMALMFDFGVKDEDRAAIVDVINGNSSAKMPNLKFDGIEFFDGENYIFCIRGCSYLTRIGACNLPEDKAAKIQDDFRDYVFNQLTKNEEHR